MEKNKNITGNIMPDYHELIPLPHPLRRIGQAVAYLFTKQQLASHGSHFNSPGADEMLLGEERMSTYWQPLLDGFEDEGGSGIS